MNKRIKEFPPASMAACTTTGRVSGGIRRACLSMAGVLWVTLSGHVVAQEIVVGQSLSLTGASPGIAQDLLRGRQACVDVVNARGGVDAKRLTLITRDDQGDPVLALQHIRKLVEQDHALAILGPMGPTINAAVLDWAARSGIAVLAPFGGDIQTRVQDWKTAFFLTANQSAEAERLANQVSTLGWKRAAVVYTGDAAGRAALTAFDEALTIAVINPVAVLELRPDGTDAAALAQAVSKSQAQVVFLATTGQATLAMLRALAATKSGEGRVLQAYGLSSSASQVDLLKLGPQARGFSMSQVLPYPRDTRTALGSTFNAALRMAKDAPSDRSYTELEGCIASLVLADVLKRKPQATPTRASVLQAFRGAGVVDLGGFDLDFANRTRPGSSFTDIVFIGADGRIVH